MSCFEIAGCGGLQIMENRPIIEECFIPGKEILVFNDFEELLDIINRAKRFPKEMKKYERQVIKELYLIILMKSDLLV